MTTDLIVCGILIHAIPGHIESLTSDLEAIPGAEVHHVTDDGRLVVTLESEDSRQAGDFLIQIQSLPDAVSASLVYHHFEETLSEGAQPAPSL